MVEIKNLVKKFNNTTVVNNVSLNIKRGEFVTIIGQSGSGKSQLMYLLGGLSTPTSGQIVVEGKDISKYKDKELSNYRKNTVGFIFQDFKLDGLKTALENVIEPTIFKGTHHVERKRKAIEALTSVGLKDNLNQIVNTLSGGQQQRVAIARALINQPKILLADEPTGSLDSKSGEEIMNLLKSLNDKGYTIIMVTHNLEQTKYADKVIRIKDGEIVDAESDNIYGSIREHMLLDIIRNEFGDKELFENCKKIISSNDDNAKKLIKVIKDETTSIMNELEGK